MTEIYYYMNIINQITKEGSSMMKTYKSSLILFIYINFKYNFYLFKLIRLIRFENQS